MQKARISRRYASPCRASTATPSAGEGRSAASSRFRSAESRRTTQETYRLRRDRQGTAQRIEQDVRNATFELAASRLAVDLARRAADAAARNLELVADQYTLGRVSLVDLIDAQTNALNTSLAAADAVNDYLLDLSRVERAVGRFMFFVSPEDREVWIKELESFAAARR